MVKFEVVASNDSIADLHYALYEDHPNSFGIVTVAGHKYGVAWCHSGIEPKTALYKKYEVYVLCAGSSVVVFSTTTGKMRLLLPLSWPFFFFEHLDFHLVIVSEISVTVLSLHSLSLENQTVLPDIIVDGWLKGNKMVLKGLGGELYEEVISIPLP